eukprot:COSAG06_NODE_46792_length_344_cov_0.742857_1_plen_82_part_01
MKVLVIPSLLRALKNLYARRKCVVRQWVVHHTHQQLRIRRVARVEVIYVHVLCTERLSVSVQRHPPLAQADSFSSRRRHTRW